jgi:hypothetical protein
VAAVGLIVLYRRSRGVIIKAQPEDVGIIMHRDLAKWLSGYPRRLTDEQVDAVYAVARRSTTWQHGKQTRKPSTQARRTQPAAAMPMAPAPVVLPPVASAPLPSPPTGTRAARPGEPTAQFLATPVHRAKGALTTVAQVLLGLVATFIWLGMVGSACTPQTPTAEPTGPAPSAIAPVPDAPPVAKVYPGCKALRMDYPSGVARPRALDDKGATGFLEDRAVFRANKQLDRDADRVLCER